MKMVYIANVRLPTEKAHGVQIMEMCRAFSQNGLEVELVVPQRLNYIKDDPFNYYGINPTFKIKKLPCLDLIYLKFGIFGFWIESVTFLLATRIYLLFKHYDILYTREAIAAIFFSKAVVEIHSLPSRLAGFIYRRAQKIIVLTSFLKIRLVKEANLLENRILVAADGVDLDTFVVKKSQKECRRKLGLPLDKKIILYTGHLYEWKGANTLLEVAQNFQFPISNFQNILFVFVGGTKEDVKLFKSNIPVRTTAVARAGGQYPIFNIQIIGHRPHAEIPHWLKAADVLVLPNSATEKISSHYTSPMKLFEYMASGVPIVASDLPSIREILNEQNAVLVRPDDPDDLARGIGDVLKNKELADKIAKNSQAEAINYSWNNRVKKIKDFIL